MKMKNTRDGSRFNGEKRGQGDVAGKFIESTPILTVRKVQMQQKV